MTTTATPEAGPLELSVYQKARCALESNEILRAMMPLPAAVEELLLMGAEFARRYLDEHAQDDDEPATELWLAAECRATLRGGEWLVPVTVGGRFCELRFVVIDRRAAGWTLALPAAADRLPLPLHEPPPRGDACCVTRGQVRRLCRALGRPLREGRR